MTVATEELLSNNFADVEMERSAIPAEWLLEGQPETRSKSLGTSPDQLAKAVIWECGAVSYHWHYTQDEAYIVLSGEGFMTDEKGVERRYGPGDLAFFPAGTNATWRHPSHFRKVAVLKEPISTPMRFALKVWNKALKTFGLADKSLSLQQLQQLRLSRADLR